MKKVIAMLLVFLMCFGIAFAEEVIPSNTEGNIEVIMPTPEPTPEPLPRSIHITSSLEGIDHVFAGTPMTLTAELINFLPDDVYEVHWEVSYDGGATFEDTGATGLEYTVIIDPLTSGCYWRAVVHID